MRFYKKSLLIIVLTTITSACGEVSYKRGASVRDIENAHAACRGVAESDFSDCLQKQGWEIQKFDDSDLFAETSVTDNRGTPPTKKDESSFVEMQENTHAENVVQSKEAQEKQMQKTENSASNSPDAAAPATSTPAAENNTIKKPAPAPVDPLKTYKINSWWKFGGTPNQLKADQTACVTTLGEAHQPDMATQTYTRGLIECLHKNGWKALKAR